MSERNATLHLLQLLRNWVKCKPGCREVVIECRKNHGQVVWLVAWYRGSRKQERSAVELVDALGLAWRDIESGAENE